MAVGIHTPASAPKNPVRGGVGHDAGGRTLAANDRQKDPHISATCLKADRSSPTASGSITAFCIARAPRARMRGGVHIAQSTDTSRFALPCTAHMPRPKSTSVCTPCLYGVRCDGCHIRARMCAEQTSRASSRRPYLCQGHAPHMSDPQPVQGCRPVVVEHRRGPPSSPSAFRSSPARRAAGLAQQGRTALHLGHTAGMRRSLPLASG